MSGKYNFKGIKKLGGAGLRMAIASTPETAWMLRFGSVLDLALEFLANWLANKGLVVLNLGAIHINGEIDQHAFDNAMEKAIDEITQKGGREKLSAAEKKRIDDEVIKAARKFIVVSKP